MIDRRWLHVATAAVLLGCTKAPLAASPDPDGPRIYRVGVASGQGDAFVTSITTLRAVPRGPDIFAFMTEHSEGSWEEGEAAMQFDSARPKASDPWPITLQHAIAAVPASIRVGEGGRPEGFEGEDSWRSAARLAVSEASLPPQATASADALIDPDGVLRDLRRNFPGVPDTDGSWVRDETIAGIPARRVERCERTDLRRRRVAFVCIGTLEGPSDGRARIEDGVSKTSLTVDAQGLVSLDLSYEGTLVLLDPSGRRVLDRPILGKRKVLRQE